GFVVAGATTIRLFVERTTPPDEDERVTDPRRAEQIEQALTTLAPTRDAGRLYGVFDAARDPRIAVLLNEGVEEHASLYEGAAGAALDDVAPYLVRFVRGNSLLERLVDEGW